MSVAAAVDRRIEEGNGLERLPEVISDETEREALHDGAYRYSSIAATPLLAQDGGVDEWLLVHSDVTERRQSDEHTANALRELNDLKAAIERLTSDLRFPTSDFQLFSVFPLALKTGDAWRKAGA